MNNNYEFDPLVTGTLAAFLMNFKNNINWSTCTYICILMSYEAYQQQFHHL